MKTDIYVEDTFGDKVNVYVKDCTKPIVNMWSSTDMFVMTPGQARELASALLIAADEAEE